jgi:hypothetical protein
MFAIIGVLAVLFGLTFLGGTVILAVISYCKLDSDEKPAIIFKHKKIMREDSKIHISNTWCYPEY